jgi:uncharacterized protein (DUF433 family)
MDEVSDRITIDREVPGGKLIIKGTRIPVFLIIELLGNSISEEEILSEYPTLKKADVKAALLYVAKHLEKESQKKESD